MAVIEQGSLNLTSATVISVNLNPGTIVGNGVTSVPTAGSAVQLASTSSIKSVTVRALSTNTGLIYIGSSSVSLANGFELSPQETVSIDINDPSKLWLDTQTNGNGVSYIYLA